LFVDISMTQMKAIRTTAFSQEQRGSHFLMTGCALFAERQRTSSRRSSEAVYPTPLKQDSGNDEA
jgi:hypothetical protein